MNSGLIVSTWFKKKKKREWNQTNHNKKQTKQTPLSPCPLKKKKKKSVFCLVLEGDYGGVFVWRENNVIKNLKYHLGFPNCCMSELESEYMTGRLTRHICPTFSFAGLDHQGFHGCTDFCMDDVVFTRPCILICMCSLLLLFIVISLTY